MPRGGFDLPGETPDIRGKVPVNRVDAAIARVSKRQHGVITRAQLLEIGVTPRAVEHRVQVGRLHRIHRGVYAVGHAALTTEATFLSAVFAMAPAALLSHHAAAAMWGIRKPRRGDVDVIVVGRDVRSRPGIRVHQAGEIWEDDIAERDGIPVTSPARTILDLASVLSEHHLKRALAKAEVEGRLTHAQLRRQLERHPRAKGRRTLERVLDAGASRTRSALEAEVAELTGATRINRIVAGHEVDLYFPDRSLIVEVDSERFHAASPTQLLLDAEKDGRLRASGMEVMRVRQRDPATTCR
jgi:very-short-patch-repair endonuclease